MLKVIKGGRFGPSPSSQGRHAEAVRSVMLPSVALTPEEMLILAMKSESVDEGCASIVESYEAAGLFGLRLAEFFTSFFPSGSPAYESAICEVIDTATLGFNRVASTREVRDQLAEFLASGLNCATSALICFAASQTRGAAICQWEPWEDGGLTDWAVWDGAPLEFSPQYAPTRERRYATRTMLMQRLLRFKDVESLGRAGIDMQSTDKF